MRCESRPIFPDERELDAPTVPACVWAELDANKAQNNGWVVFEGLTFGELRKLIARGFFKAVEADDCPVQLIYPGRSIVWSLGVSEQSFKQWLATAEHETLDKNN